MILLSCKWIDIKLCTADTIVFKKQNLCLIHAARAAVALGNHPYIGEDLKRSSAAGESCPSLQRTLIHRMNMLSQAPSGTAEHVRRSHLETYFLIFLRERVVMKNVHRRKSSQFEHFGTVYNVEVCTMG